MSIKKKILKPLLAKWGYEIRNTRYKSIFTIRQKMEECFEQLKEVGFQPDLIIDIGAASGTPPLQDSFPDAYFFWVEPLEEFKNDLEKLKMKFRGEYLIGAMGRKPGSMTIHIKPDKVGSSLLKAEADMEKEEREVSIYTLENLAAEKFNTFKRILLKVDVQGFELEVLDGAGPFLDKVEVIILEVSMFRFLKDIPDFYDVVHYMKTKGFVVYDILEGINRPLDYALGQKDLVFVKENGPFRTSHHWE